MAKFKFDDDESLGQVVANKQPFCNISAKLFQNVGSLAQKQSAEQNDKQLAQSVEALAYAAGVRMFSQLCGFVFWTKDPNTKYKRFMISFVSKTKSRIYRQAIRNPTCWYIFRPINNMRWDVLDKKACLINYGFDVDKFFESDLFEKSLPIFESQITKGLTSAETFKDMLIKQNSQYVNDVVKYINAIKEALPLMSSRQCNDKYWKLEDHDYISNIVKSLKEFDNSQLDQYRCKVTKVKENGEDAWSVDTIIGNHWVATFSSEQAANEFAEEYPMLKVKAIQASIERTHESTDEAEKVLAEAGKPPLKWHKMIDQIREQCMLVISKVVSQQKDFSPAEEVIEQLQRELDYTAFSDYNEEGCLYDAWFDGWLKGQSIMSGGRPMREKTEEQMDEEQLDAEIEEAMKKIYGAEAERKEEDESLN